MRASLKILIWTGVVTASTGLHLVAFAGLGGHHGDGLASKKPRPPTLVQMEVAPPPPAAPAPTVAHAAPRVAMARPVRAAAARAATPPPAVPTAETPADFTGTTLTNNTPGAGWTSATGNGEAMHGPVGTPGARVTGRSVDGATGGTPVVKLGDLSRVPSAPDLAPALERAYPSDARKSGLTGRAVVRARIMPDGQVRELALLDESRLGFGEACKQTLRGSRWSAPVDRAGNPVSTYVSYTCRFEVR